MKWPLHPVLRLSWVFWIAMHTFLLASGASKAPMVGAAVVLLFAGLLFISENSK